MSSITLMRTDSFSKPTVLGAFSPGAQVQIVLEHHIIRLLLVNLLYFMQLDSGYSFPTVPQTHFLSRAEIPADAFAGMPPGLINMRKLMKKPTTGSGEEPRLGSFSDLARNCTNCEDPDDLLRKALEDHKLAQLKADILRKLDMVKPPNVSGQHDISFSKPVRKLLEREREELRQNRQTNSNNKYAEIKEIVFYGEEGKQDIGKNNFTSILYIFHPMPF